MNKTNTRIVIIGGGRACRELLTMIQSDPQRLGLTVAGVADPDPDSPGVVFARESGIPTRADYHEYFQCDDVDLVVELTGLPEVRDEIFRSLPPHVHFIDHYASRFFWDFFDLAEESRKAQRQSEEQILAERNRLQEILDSLPYDILVIDKNFVVEAANRTFLEHNDLTLPAVTGKYCYDLEHKTKPPCDISVDGCPHARSLEAGQSVATVVNKVDEQGHEHFASVRAAPIRDQDGNVRGVVETVMDITERVQIEESLKETRARLNQFIDTAPLFIYMKDAALRYRVINRHALLTLGLTEAEVIGKTDFALFSEDLARRIQVAERKVLHSGRTAHHEGVLPLADRDMHFRTTLFPVHKGNEVIGLFGLTEDTTELHESELKLLRRDAQLMETRQHLQEVLEHSRDMIFLTDTDGLLISFNSGAEKVLGYNRQEVLGSPAASLCEDPSAFRQLLQTALQEGHAAQYELGFKQKDGERAVCNISLTTILDNEGTPLEIAGICRDITTRLRLQKDLVRSERLAAIGKMAAGVAHEINNPLAIMETIAGVLQDTLDEEGAALHPASHDILEKAVERLRFEVKRCMSITHSLLGFVRQSKSGRQETDIGNLLDEALNLLAAEIQNVGVEIRRDYAADLPHPVTDSMLLEQVFLNLLKNAIDAVEEKGQQEGRIDILSIQTDDGVEIAIQDNGVGIPAEAQGRIFDLFHTSKPAGKGTGLGLAIVHDITNQLGGRIQVASEEGQWTRFTLSLPLRPPV